MRYVEMNSESENMRAPGIHETTGQKIGELVDEKNRQYGNAINDTEDFLRLLYPDGIPTGHYHQVGVIVRVWDKLKRIANGNQGNEDAWQDIAGYGILMAGNRNDSSQRD